MTPYQALWLCIVVMAILGLLLIRHLTKPIEPMVERPCDEPELDDDERIRRKIENYRARELEKQHDEIRDAYAQAALIAIVGKAQGTQTYGGAQNGPSQDNYRMAAAAFVMADVMMELRDKTREETNEYFKTL